MKTLLSPAVLHMSALKELQEKPLQFFKNYIRKFGYVQAIILSLFWILFFAQVVFPFAYTVTDYSETVLTNANFSKVKFDNGEMSIDIKPEIWPFSIHNSDSYQYIVAVDSTGEMNPFYWDDRFYSGGKKVVDGVSFNPDNIFVKRGNTSRIYSYSSFVGGGTKEYTKGEVRNVIQKYFSNKSVFIYLILSLPLVFGLSLIVSISSHVLYSYIVGILISILTGKVESYLKIGMKVASGLYVGWAYTVSLLLIVQNLGSDFLGLQTQFYSIVQGVIYVALLFVGYVSIRYTSDVPHGKEIKINKVKKK